jgi:hypothetical protein
MTDVVSVTAEDSDYRYRITAQARSVSDASLTETKVNKNTQAVTNATYDASDVKVVNDVLTGTLHLPGFMTESISVERGPNSTITIKTGGLLFGVGAQIIGPFVVSDADYAAIEDWETSNFAHN